MPDKVSGLFLEDFASGYGKNAQIQATDYHISACHYSTEGRGQLSRSHLVGITHMHTHLMRPSQLCG